MKKGFVEEKTVNLLIWVAILVVVAIIIITIVTGKGGAIGERLANLWRMFT